MGPDGYLELIRAAKSAMRIPVIASLNGCPPGDGTYAKDMQKAGADALELNLLHPDRPFAVGQEVEETYFDMVMEVKAGVRIPVAVKLCPSSARWRIWPGD